MNFREIRTLGNISGLVAAIIGIYLVHRYRKSEKAYATEGLDHHPHA
jgi:hypothetical protein